jgi:hypothetical protein
MQKGENMDIEKQELIESARNFGLEVKEGTPKHILQRMVHKAQNEITVTPKPDYKNIVVGDVLEKPRDIEAEVNVAFDEVAFKAQKDAEEAIRAKIRAQLREEEIRREEMHALEIERKKIKDIKKYDIKYNIEDLKRGVEAVNAKYNNRAQIVWDNPLLGFHVVTPNFPAWIPLAQDSLQKILFQVEETIRPRNFAKTKQRDDGGVQLVSNSLSDITVSL